MRGWSEQFGERLEGLDEQICKRTAKKDSVAGASMSYQHPNPFLIDCQELSRRGLAEPSRWLGFCRRICLDLRIRLILGDHLRIANVGMPLGIWVDRTRRIREGVAAELVSHLANQDATVRTGMRPVVDNSGIAKGEMIWTLLNRRDGLLTLTQVFLLRK